MSIQKALRYELDAMYERVIGLATHAQLSTDLTTSITLRIDPEAAAALVAEIQEEGKQS